ncbi:MAG: hypothetical protein K6E71_00290 [Lachnospiraceae bacterium]|nr:hypothetical protein [Lachnospiraceae bacterium]
MIISDALKFEREYWDNTERTEDDEFMFTEALGTLIAETKNPKYMCELAWHYCEKKRFDLEIKYLEMAAECGYGPAYEELGYMWYYGQHGEKDYAKAFEYYTKGAQPDRFGNKGSLWCKYKLADMYRYGCAVQKDEGRYCAMIEEAYREVQNPKLLNDPYPEICLRLAGIRSEQGEIEEAVFLLLNAKDFMAERLSYEPFWGHIEVMGRIVRFLYKLIPFDEEDTDFYDMFYLTQTPGRYEMTRAGETVTIEVTEENGERAIGYDGKFFRSFEDFCSKAEHNGKRFTAAYDEFYNCRMA